ncbi:MAG: hypothetical protein U9R50_02740 [Campylobacterota bacterium]|nr:hypothetical protein [Campylobacterota bacterium]
MLIFGHEYLNSERFYHISTIDSIEHTPSNSLLFLEFDEKNLDIIEYMQKNELDFALEVSTLKEALFSEHLGAKYIICKNNVAKSIQDRAEHYLFDAKILCRIEEDSQIEVLATEGIDGVIYSDAIIKV